MVETGDVSAPRIYIRYGIARKKSLLKDVARAYDGLVLPGNVLLYQHRSTSSVPLMCEKPYFVDPMSYLFGQPYEDFKKRTKKGTNFKPSFVKLFAAHGLDPEHIEYSYTKLLNRLASNDSALSKFVNSALDFQQDTVLKNLSDDENLLSADLRQRLHDGSLKPEFLIPPYFLHSDSGGGDSITNTLNAKIVEFCSNHREDKKKIFPVVFIKKSHLRCNEFSHITDMVIKHEFPGYCIWVDAFDERKATMEEVKALIALVKTLSAGVTRLVVLRGGFFSMVLHNFGLDTICHGLGYGEAHAAKALPRRGSGSPPIRYYLRDLHDSLTLEDTLTILRKRNDLMCDCPVCTRVLRGDPENITRFADEEALSEMHFLWNRHQEKQMIAEHDLEHIVQYLNLTSDLYDDLTKITKTVGTRGRFREKAIIDPTYLSVWKEALERELPPASGSDASD